MLVVSDCLEGENSDGRGVRCWIEASSEIRKNNFLINYVQSQVHLKNCQTYIMELFSQKVL